MPPQPSDLSRRAQQYAWHHGVQDDRYWTERHKMIVSGEGIYVYDSDGKRYIDGTSGQAVVQIGHGRADMAEAIAEQVRTLAFSPMAFGFSHPLAGELAEQIAAMTPGALSRSWFCCTGSESVDTAIKLARQAQRRRGQPLRTKIIARRGSYHGVTYGALSATAATRLRAPSEPLVPGFRHIAQPYPRTCSWCKEFGKCTLHCADDLAAMIEFEGPETVAAFIAEPIATPETIKIPPAEYWARIMEVCRQYDVLLIADEVLVGFGRSGRLFACEHFGVEPDIMTTSKGLASGYIPIAATVATDELASLFDSPAHAFQHAGTYSGHPVACAAALKNLEIMQNEGLVANAATQGELLRGLLSPLRDFDFVRDINICGLLVAVELEHPEPHRGPARIAPLVQEAAYERGLICRSSPPSVALYPPLICTADDTAAIATILLEAFAEADSVTSGRR